MNRIEFEQISDDVVEVVIPPDTPMEMVQQLTKSFTARGLVEDLQKSTLSVRYFFKPTDKANELADELIKSLAGLAKADDLPSWHPKAKIAHAKKMRQADVAARQKAHGVTGKPEAPITPEPKPTGPRMFDNDPINQRTAGYSGKRYAYIRDPVKKEDEEDEEDDIEKSGYGPKKGGQYTPADNARRKMNNVGDAIPAGPNSNVKSYSSKPGQMSAKASAALTARLQAKANRGQPVKQWTPEEIAAENEKRGLKKSWGQHLPFPSAEEEIMRLAKMDQPSGEEASAKQLANLLMGKKMLGDIPLGMRGMFADPPPQPTDQQMFGHLEVTEEMAKKAQNDWSGTLNNFFEEATKPISQRFNSEEEELAYWSRIKVNGSSGDEGY